MPDWISPATTLASTFFAAVAAGAGIAAVIIARRTLREAHSTTELQGKTIEATNVVATKAQATSQLLDQILAEAQAARELEQLRFITNQVATVIDLRQKVSSRRLTLEREPVINAMFTSAKDTLAVFMASIPEGRLAKSRALADRSDSRVSDPQLEQDAIDELRRETEDIVAKLR